MATLFISDLHLTMGRPRMLLQFYEFLETQAAHADALYILGDLFEYWIGDDAAEATGNEPIVVALGDLAQSDVAVYFIPGNRDFLVGEEFAQRTQCQVLHDPTVIELYGQRTLIMHGDSLCTDDVKHQAFRAMVDCPSWQRVFLSKPIKQRLAMAKEARFVSEQHKTAAAMDIMDVNEKAVERAMLEYDVDLLIHGHTHRPAVHEFIIDGVARQRIVLGDWYEQQSVLSITPERCTLTPVTEPQQNDSSHKANV